MIFFLFFAGLECVISRLRPGIFTKKLCNCSQLLTTSQLPHKMGLQGLYSFELIKFNDFPWRFPRLFPVFHDLKFSCHFQKLIKSSFFSGVFWHNLPVFYFALALAPAIIYIPHILWNCMAFQTWKLKYLNSMTFKVFHDPYEPWTSFWVKMQVFSKKSSTYIFNDR